MKHELWKTGTAVTHAGDERLYMQIHACWLPLSFKDSLARAQKQKLVAGE